MSKVPVEQARGPEFNSPAPPKSLISRHTFHASTYTFTDMYIHTNESNLKEKEKGLEM